MVQARGGGCEGNFEHYFLEGSMVTSNQTQLELNRVVGWFFERCRYDFQEFVYFINIKVLQLALVYMYMPYFKCNINET